MRKEAGLGPRPGRGSSPAPRLSRGQAALLAVLDAQPGPTSLTALVAQTGLHANTVREHLDGLVRQDLVRRHRSDPSGRGRPAWLYEPTVPRSPAGSTPYAGLAATLAAAIAGRSSAPRDDAVAAGTEWGRQLADAGGAPSTSSSIDARRHVVRLLGEFGFGPEPDEQQATVRLTRCPLLETAARYPDIVCGVHLGLVRGALERYGADPSDAELIPFAEPGACRLELGSRPGARS